MKEVLTTWQKEQAQCANKIAEYKLASEANVVASIYKNPELIYDLDLKLEDISNNTWRVFFAIAHGLILNENKTVLDEITIGTYLDKHLKLKAKVDDYGGFSTIQDAMSYINLDNFDGYVSDIKKFNVLLELLKYGFPISERLSEYVDKSLDDIYEELEMLLNHTFVSADRGIKSYNAFEGINEYIDSLNQGSDIGMPFNNADLLNAETGGLRLGTMTGLGGLSGTGKSLLAFNYLVPSAIKYNLPMCFILNEEEVTRFQKELLCWVCNNILNKEVNKYQLRNGHFNDKLMETLRDSAKWIEEKKEQHLLTIVPLQRYSCKTAIKLIKKYAGLGVKYFLLDTMKPSADSRGEIYQTMMEDSVALYDTIKPTSLNVCLLCTYQLNKGSSKIRKYTGDNIGMAKNIADVMSLNIMVRFPYADEYGGNPKALKCYRIEGKTKIPFELDDSKSYIILFIVKNRYGRANHQQIVAEFDMGTDTYKEVGFTSILEDW